LDKRLSKYKTTMF